MEDPTKPGKHPPVPQSKDELIIEALRYANRVSGMLNDMSAMMFNSVTRKTQEKIEDMLRRRFSDCSGLHLFIAANNLHLDLPEDLRDDEDAA